MLSSVGLSGLSQKDDESEEEKMKIYIHKARFPPSPFSYDNCKISMLNRTNRNLLKFGAKAKHILCYNNLPSSIKNEFDDPLGSDNDLVWLQLNSL